MIDAISKELILRKNELDLPVESIYFGGGTPSILKCLDIDVLMEVIFKHYRVVKKPEITLEANPDDLTKQKIKGLSSSGINRLSIGVQSFFDDDLKFMNRAHNATEAKNSILESKNYFDNITIDLIYGVPNMTNEKWMKNLQKAFDLNVSHISSYALTVEEKTALSSFIKKGKYPPVDDVLASNHFQILVKETKNNNFIQYEISNFGKEGYFSKHNASYWKGAPYIGIGPSAHSFNGHARSWNLSNNIKYIKSIQKNILPQEIEELSINDRFNESIMTGLRTIWGVSLNKIEIEFGLEYKVLLLKNVQKYLNNQTVHIKDDLLLITDKGKFLADGIAADLFIVTK